MIQAIFFSEFHPTLGPKISYQVPEDYVSKEIFDAVSVYIIPKEQLDSCIITVNVLGHKITGYPVRISDEKYPRNFLIFNLCFVCDSDARTVQYELVVRKLAEHLVTLEVEQNFLSTESNRALLPKILGQIRSDLNHCGLCTVTVGTSTLHLKVIQVAAEPPPVFDHHVPVFTSEFSPLKQDYWDLTTKQVLPYIDGRSHVARVAIEADVDIGLVKACIQNLLYYGVVQLIPIFQYSNMYAATPKLRELPMNSDLSRECITFVAKSDRHPPSFRDVFQMYCGMTYGTTIRDLCLRFNPHALRIDEHRLVQFGVLQGIIRRICKYPVYKPETQRGSHKKQMTSLHALCTGVASYDEICCRTGMSYHELDEKIEADADICVLWK
ncbi:hypothetical protein GHT06_013774 [Daphnia sinensis]|uniref:Nitrogen permease regulator 2-like protein n=1 Tax=Daphnia sinensis TaxID=1820382 RepID=A0AAD5PVL2_9CRUS|nr:hypothetical protein GHT06_013774 [Daphnia sinensis]